MTDEHNDHDHPGAAAPGEFDNNDFDDFDTGAKTGTLAEMWNNNPLVKIAALVVGLILVIGLMILFGARAPRTPLSTVAGSASDVKQVPGTEEVSKSYQEAVQETNQVAAENAEKTGGSAIPVPINPAKEPVALPEDQANAEDPLARWRRIQEERNKREQLKKPDVPVEDNGAAIKSLAEAMSKQMESILKNLKPQQPRYKVITSDKDWQEIVAQRQKAQQQSTAAQAATAAGGTQVKDVDIIVPAGNIAYAQLITQANTDAPGPVLAQIVSGPLSGDRILGSFKASDEYLILSFDTVVIDGISYPVEAIALDPKTANPGMVSDIDHRYMTRVVLPAAAAFIQGLGSAIADNGNTSISVQGDTVASSTSKLNTKQQVFKGVEQGASKIGDLLDQQATSTKTLITVDAGTPIGILFTSPVTKDSNTQTARTSNTASSAPYR